MKALDDYDRAAKGKPTVEGALHAFLDTDLDLYIQGGEGWKNNGAFGAQASNSPEGAEFMDKYFDPVVLRLRSEEHTSELQSLMRSSNAGFSWKKKKKKHT